MKKRIGYLDIIRLFACFCVITVHFNASISGYDIYGAFHYSNSLIPNEWFGVYLGTLGVGLFFLISGVALEYSNPKVEDWRQFYKKRFLSIYPGFWIAFIISLIITFWKEHTLPNAPLWHLFVSFAGFDGYAMSMGFQGSGFYQVGEWFLGCIILIYAIYPLLSYLLHRWPIPFLTVYSIGWVALSVLKVNMDWFFMWSYYVVLGMTFVRFGQAEKQKWIWLVLVVVVLFRIVGDGVLQYSFKVLLTSGILFLFIVSIGNIFKEQIARASGFLKNLSGLTYPVFLIHHRLIFYWAKEYDLSCLSRRNCLFLYIQYVMASFFLGWTLTYIIKRLTQKGKIDPVASK